MHPWRSGIIGFKCYNEAQPVLLLLLIRVCCFVAAIDRFCRSVAASLRLPHSGCLLGTPRAAQKVCCRSHASNSAHFRPFSLYLTLVCTLVCVLRCAQRQA